MKYCLGFAFSTDTHCRTYVALIEKSKPQWQAGKYNGIGGKIEDTDTDARAAMVREFREETGVDTDADAWKGFAVMKFWDCEVECFVGQMEWEKFNSLWSPTEEQVVKVDAHKLWPFPVLPNLHWLVPMAQAFLYQPDLRKLDIGEIIQK